MDGPAPREGDPTAERGDLIGRPIGTKALISTRAVPLFGLTTSMALA